MWVNNANLWPLIGKNCLKFIVCQKMSTIFLRIVCKQCLHACDFFHVWVYHYHGFSATPTSTVWYWIKSYPSMTKFYMRAHYAPSHPTILTVTGSVAILSQYGIIFKHLHPQKDCSGNFLWRFHQINPWRHNGGPVSKR